MISVMKSKQGAVTETNSSSQRRLLIGDGVQDEI